MRLLPLSAPFLWSAASRLSSAASGPMLPRAGWALVAAALATSVPIRRYYMRRFGNTRKVSWRNMFTWLGSLAALFALEWAREAWRVPVSLLIVFVAVVLARLGLSAHRLRVHYLWITAACLLFSLLAPLGASSEIRAAAFDLLLGIGLLIAAIGDDRVLRRVMDRKVPA